MKSDRGTPGVQKNGAFKQLLLVSAAFFLLILSLGCASTPSTPAPTASPQITDAAAGSQAVDTQKTETPSYIRENEDYAHRSKSYIPSAQPVIVPFYGPPDRIDLCGDPVPLDEADVWERFDREFTLVVYNQAQVYLWLKRMERYFPWIEERLQYHGLPEDLKYVAIVESDLVSTAQSPKGAAGPWQFMPSTGQAYGLDQKDSVDLRYDFERSTDAAFRLLRDLYVRYNDWVIAIATYNCGDKRVLDAMQSQGVRNFYHMRLPLETERYIFRILAVKTVLNNPEKYGYRLPGGQGYPQLALDHVTVNSRCPIPLQAVAERAGTTFREVRRLNPIFRADHIPAGSHEVKLPAGSGARLQANLDRLTAQFCAATPAPRVTSSRAPAGPGHTAQSASTTSGRQQSASRHHTVAPRETLTGIAARYKVKVDDLKKANRLSGSGSHIIIGQKLVIP